MGNLQNVCGNQCRLQASFDFVVSRTRLPGSRRRSPRQSSHVGPTRVSSPHRPSIPITRVTVDAGCEKASERACSEDFEMCRNKYKSLATYSGPHNLLWNSFCLSSFDSTLQFAKMHSLTSTAVCFLSLSAFSLAKPINSRQIDSEYHEGQGRRLLGSSFGSPGEFVTH
jgi:hypothetical protein